MNHRWLTTLLAAGITVAGFRAGALSLEEFTPAPERAQAELQLLKNGDFEQGMAHWSGGAAVDRRGINQTGGLHYVRHDDSYESISQPVTLKPGQSYVFGAMVRTEKVEGEGAALYLEGYENGQYVGGAYAPPITGSRDWTQIEWHYTAPAERPEATYHLALYMRRGSKGEAWFDDVYLRESIPHWQLEPVYPTHWRICNGEPLQFTSRFTGFDQEAYPDSCVLIQVGGQPAVELPAGSGLLQLRPADLPPGEVTVRCAWVDKKTRSILEEKDFILLAAEPSELPANAAMVDARHRLIVDGKPFLPLGLYTQQVSREDVDAIAAGGFNCILPYPSYELRFPDSGLSGLEAIREVMDYCQERGVKVIFSLKDIYPGFRCEWAGEVDPDEFATLLVDRLKDHPALLAWYISDEVALGQIPVVVARRRLVNALDPCHPTYAVYYQVPDFQHYIPTQDVFGNDPYPINFMKDEHILGVDNSTGKAESLNMPLWAVPQIHHTGFYNSNWNDDPADYFVKLRAPDENEMTTICLFEAMRRAKGFVMYSYFDLNWGPDPLQFERRWPEVCRVAAQLNRLVPYLLSDVDGPATAVTAAEGRVYARTFALPDGSLNTIVVSPGPGQADAEIVVGDGVSGLLSERGRTFEARPGVYRFSSLGVGYDVLRSGE